MMYITREDSIDVLGLSVRTYNCLQRVGVNTIGKLLDFPQEQLRSIRNLGAKSEQELLDLIQDIHQGQGYFILISGDNTAFESIETSPDCTTTDDCLFLAEDGSYKIDVRIDETALPVRAINSLNNSGYIYLSELLPLSLEELLTIRNMGRLTADQVLTFVHGYIFETPDVSAEPPQINPLHLSLAQELSSYGILKTGTILQIMDDISVDTDNSNPETLLQALINHDNIRTALKHVLLRALEMSESGLSFYELSALFPPCLKQIQAHNDIIRDLLHDDSIIILDKRYFRSYPSIRDIAESMENDTWRTLLIARLEDKTLDEAGQIFGITRERVRQIVSKILHSLPPVREDRYAVYYKRYDFSKEDFLLTFDEPEYVYHYLAMRYKTKHDDLLPLSDILLDDSIAVSIRRKAERTVYKRYITINGTRVLKNRQELVRYVVSTHCRDITSFDDFLNHYNSILESYSLTDSNLLIESRTYENHLSDCNYALWNQWRRLRYYNIAEHDFGELVSTINLPQYNDIEFSTLKLFRDHGDLMQEYDIQDEYELHNLLKKIWPEWGNCEVEFARMPTLRIGNTSLDNQVTELLMQNAPIANTDLAQKYEELYGVKAATALSNYFGCINNYFHKGIYTVTHEAMTAEQYQCMSDVLTNDFYTISDLRRIFQRECPDAPISLVNTYNIRVLGFLTYSNYVIRSTYSAASEYFRSLLTSDDVVDTREFPSSLTILTAYSSELLRLRREREIIEFLPRQYINMRRLKEYNVTHAEIESFCQSIWDHIGQDQYFTISSLRNDGFSHPLDELYFDEWFYSSLLAEDPDHFSTRRMGGTRLLYSGKMTIQFSSFLEWLLERAEKIELYDLVNLLDSHYGISMPKSKIIETIKDTGLYYDAIMDTVYIDYDTYFEEI